MTAPLLETEGLSRYFGGQRRFLGRTPPLVRAVEQVDLSVSEGEALGIVGESGCGKSTLAKVILGLLQETAGRMWLEGREVSGLARPAARRARKAIQYVHQDPGAALDPWWRVGDTLAETLRIGGVSPRAARDQRIEETLQAVGLDPDIRRRYPHELSGGQQRRIGLARTLALLPRIVILDEPTSGLDLSVQASVLRLMEGLRRDYALTYLFISHDLSVVRRICDRVAVMYLGRLVEVGPVEHIFADPRHPYTRALLASAPGLKPAEIQVPVVSGDPPSPGNAPSGCAFRTRCPHAEAACSKAVPPLARVRADHYAACPVINPAP